MPCEPHLSTSQARCQGPQDSHRPESPHISPDHCIQQAGPRPSGQQQPLGSQSHQSRSQSGSSPRAHLDSPPRRAGRGAWPQGCAHHPKPGLHIWEPQLPGLCHHLHHWVLMEGPGKTCQRACGGLPWTLPGRPSGSQALYLIWELGLHRGRGRGQGQGRSWKTQPGLHLAPAGDNAAMGAIRLRGAYALRRACAPSRWLELKCQPL